MKEMLTNLADGQIELYKSVRIFDSLLSTSTDLTGRYLSFRPWKSGTASFRYSSVFVWMFKYLVFGQ